MIVTLVVQELLLIKKILADVVQGHVVKVVTVLAHLAEAGILLFAESANYVCLCQKHECLLLSNIAILILYSNIIYLSKRNRLSSHRQACGFYAANYNRHSSHGLKTRGFSSGKFIKIYILLLHKEAKDVYHIYFICNFK